MDDRYDAMLLGILQNEGKIDRFLDVIFSFLCRRTDFYHILTKEKQHMGFPPGIALKMVMNSFKSFETLHREQYNAVADAPPVAKTVEVVTEERKSSSKPCGSNAKQTSGRAESLNNSTKATNVEKPATSSSENEKQETHEQAHHRGDEKPHGTSEESSDRAYQAPAESYNGADRGLYFWSQTIGDLDLRVRVPSHVKKAKDIKVKITKKRLTIQICEETSNEEFKTLLDDEFPWPINTEESMWSLLPSDGQIHINVEKVKERWWNKALEEDKDTIDVRKIDCSRPISDLDDESQAKIQQLMYDQRQKNMGLPTSEEEKMSKILAKAWNAEGSPFKGQEFDPSRVHIGPDGSATVD